jgi:hypothetical protein
VEALLSGLLVLLIVTVVVAGNRRGQRGQGRPGLARLGGAAAWTITVTGGVAAALLVTRGVLEVVDANSDTVPIAAGAVLAAFGIAGLVVVRTARRR